MLPLALLFTGERGDPAVGAGAVVTMFLVAALFPVYYNVLSQFVNRRDELVLKRMRTGETRDAELLVSIALPGAISALVLTAVAVPVAAAVGQPLPVNPLLYAALAVLTVTMFTAFAYWTAAWTRSAESAQLTSLPIIFLASLGPLGVTISGMADRLQRHRRADAGRRDVGAGADRLVRLRRPGRDGGDAELRGDLGPGGRAAARDRGLDVRRRLLARRSMRWEPRVLMQRPGTWRRWSDLTEVERVGLYTRQSPVSGAGGFNALRAGGGAAERRRARPSGRALRGRGRRHRPRRRDACGAPAALPGRAAAALVAHRGAAGGERRLLHGRGDVVARRRRAAPRCSPWSRA